MQLELRRGGRTARIDTLGGELVSYRDEAGLEYIWPGDPAYWPGRNPLLFPIVGVLRDGKIQMDGTVFQMERHGFARWQEFAVAEHGPDWAVLELREGPQTLSMYPYPFCIQVRQQLEENGFSTAVTVTNTGERTMPFCLGAHTGFRCPLEAGECFEDYEVVFDQRESCPTLLPDEQGLDRSRMQSGLDGTDTLRLSYPYFDEVGTVIYEGLRSQSVRLRSRKSGTGVRVSFPGFPILALWTMSDKRAPFLCIEPWHGAPAIAGEGPEMRDKAYCIQLAPGESRTLAYQVETL